MNDTGRLRGRSSGRRGPLASWPQGCCSATAASSRGRCVVRSAFGGESKSAEVKDLTSTMMGVSTDIADQCRTAATDRRPTALALTSPGGVLAAVAIALFLIGERRSARLRRPPAES